MSGWKSTNGGGGKRSRRRAAARDWPALMLRVVDGALAGLIFVAPMFLGGRHDVGRLVFAVLVGTAGVAWFARQALLGRQSHLPKAVVVVVVAGAAMLMLQLAPLPASWLAWLAPRTAEVLPLWSGAAAPGTLGIWRTISLEPEATRLSLAMFAAYALLFVTVYQRVENEADVVRLVRWVGLSAGVMAVVGFAQFAVPNGKFLWIYEHPTRDAGERLGGAFANRNHFAHFVALGAPALAAWLAVQLSSLRPPPLGGDGWGGGKQREHAFPNATDYRPALGRLWVDRARLLRPRRGEGAGSTLFAVAAMLVVACAAVMLSCSRGGALALAAGGGIVGACLWRARLLGGRQLALLAGAGVAAFLLIAFTGYEQVMDRLGALAAESLDEVDAGGGRRRIWQANLAAIRAGGWVGSGAGSHAEVYPLYAADPPGKHYTHAESGYLQIVTENGLPGAALLAAVLALAGTASWRALARPASAEAFAYAAAGVAALASSAVHATCDFVWYIPACMGATLVLAACVCRAGTRDWSLKQPVRFEQSGGRAPGRAARAPLPWAVGAALAASFAVLQLLTPALAAPRWDAYARMADAHRDFEARLVALTPEEFQVRLAATQRAELAALESMIAELEAVVQRRPAFAAAQAMLANRCVQLFNLRQSLSDNRLPLSQVRDAAIQSQFATATALREWLTRALDGNHELLYRAWGHARTAAALSPLEGEPYVRLAELCFLEGRGFAEADAYLEQATVVRPLDGNLLFEAGRQWVGRGLGERAAECWTRAMRIPGPHRVQIAATTAGNMPAADIIARFAPQWDALPVLWQRRSPAAAEDAAAIIAYAREQAERETPGSRPAKAVFIWRTLGQMQREAGEHEAALASLERACGAAADDWATRKLLGLELCELNRTADAEAHLRWCRHRRPGDPAVDAALVRIGRERIAATHQDETTIR